MLKENKNVTQFDKLFYNTILLNNQLNLLFAEKRMEFTVHHTCKKNGGEELVLQNFPYLSIYQPEQNKRPFLGEGFYFWDYNLEYAKVWGKIHCSPHFFVCEANIYIDYKKDYFYLDLAGNRKHLTHFVQLLKEFNLIHPEGTKGIDLCYIIDYLRKYCTEAFPFSVIRAVDYDNDKKKGISINFNGITDSYTILNPRVIFSFQKKEDICYLDKPFIKFAS